MPSMLTPIYEQDPARGKALHDRLTVVHQDIMARRSTTEPACHAARAGDWNILLETSAAGDLQAASMTRYGQEKYDFMHTEGTTWAALEASHFFEDAHFHNLVTLAVRDGLEWTEAPIEVPPDVEQA